MRITEEEKQVFINAVKKQDNEAKIFLFGSRTDDYKKGGDIDLLIISEQNAWELEKEIRFEIFSYIEEQKIDIIVAKDFDDSFVQSIKADLLELL
jgi:uncharacterized protein